MSESYRKAIIDRCYGHKSDRAEMIRKKSNVIPNGLEPFWLENKGVAKTGYHDVLRLICVGKIDHNKNMEIILHAMEKLAAQGIRAKLTVIGQVVDQDVLRVLKDNDNVELIEYQKKEGLIDYYLNNDIYVMPSITESFGRVYAEAMSQGLPVIYTRGQGFDGIFPEGEVGFSVDPHNAEEIADSIIKVLNNYSTISGNCIRDCTLFDWITISCNLEKMYHKAVGEN